MKKLSIHDLDQLHHIKVTKEMIPLSHMLTRSENIEYFRTVMHEMAHFLAALACPGSYISKVIVYPPRKRTIQYRGALGEMYSSEIYEDEEVFVSLVGYGIEYTIDQYPALCPNGPLAFLARNDLAYGQRAGYEWVMGTAIDFVKENLRLINKCAVGHLLLARKDGVLKGRSLNALADWARPQLQPFISKERTEPFLFAGRKHYPCVG